MCRLGQQVGWYIEGEYAWFIADVGRDEAGLLAIRVHHWNRKEGTVGQLFEMLRFAEGDDVRLVAERNYYEVVDVGPLKPSPSGETRIALRRQTLTETVPA